MEHLSKEEDASPRKREKEVSRRLDLNYLEREC